MSDIKNETSIGGLKATAVAFIVVISYFFTVFGIILPILILFLEQQTLAALLVSIIALPLNLILFVGNAIYIIIFTVLAIFQIIAAINAISGKEYEIPYIGKVVKLLFNN